MVHGHGGDHRGLIKLAKLMKAPVYVPDLPGFGKSETLELHSMENYTKALLQLFNHLGINKYNLVGHSLGSAIALVIASQDIGVQKLVLINAVPTFRTVIKHLLNTVHSVSEKIPENLAHRLIHAGLYNIATFLLHSSKRKDIKLAKQYINGQAQVSYSVRAWREAGEAIYNLDQMQIAKKIKVPTLLIHGQRDKMVAINSMRQFQAQFKNAVLCDLKNSSHFIPLEQPDQSAEIINNFLYHTS